MSHLIRLGTAALVACCGLGLAAPAAHAQPQSSDAPATRANSPEDAATADRVSAALKAEPHHFYRHVTVSVTNGVVSLGGLVYSNDAISHAEEIAQHAWSVARREQDAARAPGSR